MARLRIAALGRLRAFDDTFEVEDPLGLGITFEIARRDSREHLAWIEKRAAADPVVRAMDRNVFSQLMQIAEAKEGDEAVAALEGANRLAIFNKLVASGDVAARDLLRSAERDRSDEAVALIKGWKGAGVNDAQTGKPVACTPENVRDLLTSDAEITDGEHEGKTLGEVLQPWVIEQASQRTRLARRVAEEAGKTSAPPSGSF